VLLPVDEARGRLVHDLLVVVAVTVVHDLPHPHLAAVEGGCILIQGQALTLMNCRAKKTCVRCAESHQISAAFFIHPEARSAYPSLEMEVNWKCFCGIEILFKIWRIVTLISALTQILTDAAVGNLTVV
jgi:hypothetical protein